MANYCYVKFDHNGGAATPAVDDAPATPDEAWVDGDSGAVYLDVELSEELPNRITIPTWAGRTFLGYFDSLSGGTAYVSRNGYVNASRFANAGWSLIEELTLYARWEENFYRVSISLQGGSIPDGGTTRLYYDKTNRGLYLNTALTSPASTIGAPTRECYRIQGGFYTQANGGGVKVLNSDGSIPSATQQMEFTGDTTFYANWTRVSYKVTLDWNGGRDNDAGTARTALYFRVATGGDLPADRIYGDDQCSGSLVTGFSTRRPQRDGFSFAGYYANEDGTGTQYVNSGGSVQNALKQPSTAFTADFKIYAAWSQNSWVISLNKQGGIGGKSRLYNKLSTTEVYTDVELATPFSTSNAISTPTKPGYQFAGYYAKASGSGVTKYVNSNGKPYDGNSGPIFKNWGKDASIYAQWTAYRYTLTFDANGGAFPGGATTQARSGVEYGSAIGGTFPTPTRANHVFGGWLVSGKLITPSTKYKWADDVTAYALWLDSFGNVTDYFGVEGSWGMDPLILVRAESGARRATVATTGASSTTNGNITTVMAGKLAIQSANSAVAAYWAGSELINPVCTYRVKAAGTVSFTLGKAYHHPFGDFMLVAVEYRTRADGEPTLTLRGVANEGADAINTWTVSIYVSPDHVAQDPLSAVSGGGELVACETVASAEPVVVYENGLPCASDVVRGRIAVRATTSTYAGEGAPSAGGGFLPVAAPNAEEDVDFTTYSFEAERSL